MEEAVFLLALLDLLWHELEAVEEEPIVLLVQLLQLKDKQEEVMEAQLLEAIKLDQLQPMQLRIVVLVVVVMELLLRHQATEAQAS
jgi:hypothetical protein